jgi:hypothetical protein
MTPVSSHEMATPRPGLKTQIFRVKFPKKNLIPGLPKVIFSEEKKAGEAPVSRHGTSAWRHG